MSSIHSRPINLTFPSTYTLISVLKPKIYGNPIVVHQPPTTNIITITIMIPTTSTSSTNIWEKVAQELQENGGVASLPLADLNLFAGKSQIQTHDWEEFFQVARNGMDHCKQLSSSSSFFITPDQDSAHVTGWHSAGCESDAAGSSLSRYNEYREGRFI